MGGVLYNWSIAPFHNWCLENTIELEKCQQKLGKFNFDPHMSGLQNKEEVSRAICQFYFIPYHPGRQLQIGQKMMEGDGQEIAISRQMLQYNLSKGVKNALLSNASPWFEDSWRHDDLLAPQDRFFSFDLGMVKPDLEIYKKVQTKLGVTFEEMIFIDDKPQNVAAAESLGIHGIVFTPDTLETELKKLIF